MDKAADCEAFAKYLIENKKGIASQFVTIVRHEPRIPGAGQLPKAQVLDCMTEFMLIFAEQFCRPDDAPHRGKVEALGRLHGLHRWEQGFGIEELAYEFSIFRQLLMFHIATFQLTQVLGIESRLSVNHILHKLLDELTASALSGFATHIAKSGRLTNPSWNAPL